MIYQEKSIIIKIIFIYLIFFNFILIIIDLRVAKDETELFTRAETKTKLGMLLNMSRRFSITRPKFGLETILK